MEASSEYSITYRKAESLCYTPEINVTLYVNYTQIIFVLFYFLDLLLQVRKVTGKLGVNLFKYLFSFYIYLSIFCPFLLSINRSGSP